MGSSGGNPCARRLAWINATSPATSGAATDVPLAVPEYVGTRSVALSAPAILSNTVVERNSPAAATAT